MARDMTPIVKQSRREKVALHPKAIKGMTRRPYGPGEHGQSGMRSKLSQYAVQLREKQKVKRSYGLLEKQFVKLVKEAERREGVSGEILIVLLEQRLDNTIYRLGLATSRRAARQLVTHGHFLLNGRRVDIPSIRVKAGDVITIRPKSAANEYFKVALDGLAAASDQNRWISWDGKKQTATVTGLPVREDVIDLDINEQLIIEFYSR